METSEYPALYRESESCVAENQKKHKLMLSAKISLPIAVAIMSSLSSSGVSGFEVAGIIVAIVLLALLVLTFLVDYSEFDKTWFGTRALAENVKKHSWLFMMRTKPYDASAEADAERNFVENLLKTAKTQANVSAKLCENTVSTQQVTEKMRHVRSMSLAERLDFYRDNRIRDQHQWYSRKARFNKKREKMFFALSWVFQFAAVLLAFAVFFLSPIINLVGSLTTVAAALISWMNARHYRENSQTYGLVARELTVLEEEGRRVFDQKGLDELAGNVEGVISREQDIWLARRIVTK